MSWRNHKTHAEETHAVKEALRNAGIPFRKVGHGTGTTWAWLEIYLGTPENYRKYHQEVLAIAQAITGRRGDYHGDISILAQ